MLFHLELAVSVYNALLCLVERAFQPATTAFGPPCSCAGLKRHVGSTADVAG